MAVARGGGGGERARTLGLIGVLPRVRPAEHVVDHLPLERRLRRHFALELEHIWARPAKEAHVLLILRQDGAASAWRAARVRARREAAHLEEQEVAAGRAEVHGSFATRGYRSRRPRKFALGVYKRNEPNCAFGASVCGQSLLQRSRRVRRGA